MNQDTVDTPTLNCFKNRLNKIRCTRMGFFMDYTPLGLVKWVDLKTRPQMVSTR